MRFSWAVIECKGAGKMSRLPELNAVAWEWAGRVGQGLGWLAGRGLGGTERVGGWLLGLLGLLGLLAAGAVWQLGYLGLEPLPPGGVLVLVGGGWALSAAAAAGLSAGGFAVASLWLAWHGIALMGPWTGTPLVAWPVLWLLGVARWRFPEQGGGLVWVGMALGAGWLVAEPSGWNQFWGLGPERAALGRLALGGGLAALGCWWRPRGGASSFGVLALGGILAMGAGLAASGWRDLAAVEGWAWGVVESSGAWAALAWFWLGGGFAVLLLQGAEGMARRVMGRSDRGKAWWLVGWLMATLVEWLATHGGMPYLGSWGAAGPRALRLAAEAHVWVGLVVVVFGVGFMWQGRELARLMSRLQALWAAAFLGLWTVAEALPGGVAGEAGVGGGWLLGLGGLWVLWGLRRDAAEGSGLEWPFRLGGLAALSGVVLAVGLQPGEVWGDRGGAAALLGMLHLAVPMALHRWWTGGRVVGTGPTLEGLVWASLGGVASALPFLQRNPGDAVLLAGGPLLWLGGLLWLRACQPRWDAAAGALAGAVMGGGAVAAWCRPGLLLPEVPLWPWLNVPSAALGDPLSRPFLDPRHFILWSLLGISGALLGALVFRGRGGAEGLGIPLLVDPPKALVPGF